jgi:hypothetical protein
MCICFLMPFVSVFFFFSALSLRARADCIVPSREGKKERYPFGRQNRWNRQVTQ